METKSLELINTLERTFREQHQMRMLRAASQCAAVLSSSLFINCLEVQRVLIGSNPVDKFEKLLGNHVIPSLPCGLPPFSAKLLLARLEQINPQLKEHDIYTVQLPENHPCWEGRRAGLILRQHLVQGQIKALFVAGTEQNSPANRALNLQCGDRLLAVSGFPLDWRTLELHHFGLLDAENLKGLRSNANMHDLACHLLDEPYRLQRNRRQSNEPSPKPLLVLACQRTNKTTNDNKQESNLNTISGSFRFQGIGDESQTEMEYRETVLNATNEDSGLGLQLGFDEASKGIYIVSILPNSQAALDGILQEGDKIVEVNYQDISSLDSREALKKIKMICQKMSFLHMKVARRIHDLDDPIGADDYTSKRQSNEQSYAVATKVQTKPSTDFVQDAQSVGRTASRVEEKPTQGPKAVKSIHFNEESSLTKLSKKYAFQLDYWRNQFPPEVEILVTEYDISKSTCGLGISIEGTMEQEFDDSALQSHHYIVDLAPQGPLQIQGVLKAEDELLEINEQILYGEEHLKVARILHSIDSQGYIICARYKKVNKSNLSSNYLIEEQPGPAFSTNANTVEHPESDLKDLIHLSTDSEDTSDVDRNPTPPRVIIARSARFVPAAEKIPETTNVSQEFYERKEHATERYILNEEEINDKRQHSSRNISVSDQDSSLHLPIAVTRKSPDADTYPRLPMPVKLAKLNETRPQQRERIQSHLVLHSSSKTDQVEYVENAEVSFRPEENCFSVKIMKRAGEFLGLEIDSEDGGPNGISLLSIISGSPLDYLKPTSRLSHGWGSRISLPSYSTSSGAQTNMPFPQPGDWIVGVAGYTFRNRENFKARRLLRRLVVSAGTFEIHYIPRDWAVPNQTKTLESAFSSSESELNLINQEEFTEPEPSDG